MWVLLGMAFAGVCEVVRQLSINFRISEIELQICHGARRFTDLGDRVMFTGRPPMVEINLSSSSMVYDLPPLMQPTSTIKNGI